MVDVTSPTTSSPTFSYFAVVHSNNFFSGLHVSDFANNAAFNG